jgi:F-type H+-transporting ATPase subunit delta
MAASDSGGVANRYARALYELGQEKGLSDLLGAELEALATTFATSSELRQTLENPVFKLSERRAVLEKLLPRLAPSRELKNFALLLLERGRIGALPAISRAYRAMVDTGLGRVRAVVTSAQPLDALTQAAVQRALEKRTGRKVLLSTVVDPGLIGGIIARVGDLVFDGSLRSRLDTLRARLLN